MRQLTSLCFLILSIAPVAGRGEVPATSEYNKAYIDSLLEPRRAEGPEVPPVDAKLLARAKAGDGEAQFKVCEHYLKFENPTESLKWLTRSAESGYAKAQSLLGLGYQSGAFGTQDSEKALHWIGKAAENGDREAQFALGEIYWRGDLTGENPAKAVRWWKQAAEAGQKTAMLQYAVSCYQGYGVEPDAAQAFAWYKKAADAGAGGFAHLGLGICYYVGAGVNQNDTAAFAAFKAAANAELPLAHFALWECYYAGRGVARNAAKAYEHIRAAEKLGLPGADKIRAATAKGEKLENLEKDPDLAGLFIRKRS